MTSTSGRTAIQASDSGARIRAELCGAKCNCGRCRAAMDLTAQFHAAVRVAQRSAARHAGAAAAGTGAGAAAGAGLDGASHMRHVRHACLRGCGGCGVGTLWPASRQFSARACCVLLPSPRRVCRLAPQRNSPARSHGDDSGAASTSQPTAFTAAVAQVAQELTATSLKLGKLTRRALPCCALTGRCHVALLP